eukprot:scaffold8000_cov61-Cyclotella_meneghiniana.AAC.7
MQQARNEEMVKSYVDSLKAAFGQDAATLFKIVPRLQLIDCRRFELKRLLYVANAMAITMVSVLPLLYCYAAIDVPSGAV